jgi:signal transduction histidine kinase
MVDSEKANILVVDDLPEKLVVFQTILEDLGQNVVTARSGSDALKQVLQSEFAVILLDVNMPTMDGFETARLIRSRKRSAHTPIIFITAFADEVRAVQGYAHGAVDYILAPVVPEILRAKVKVFVDLFQMTRQVKRQAEQSIALAEERAKREAAEESNQRLQFLARASGVLGQSLDPQVTARDLAQLPVPFLADLAVVVLLPRPGDREHIFVARPGSNGAVSVDELMSLAGLPVLLLRLIETARTSPNRDVLTDVGPGMGETHGRRLARPLQARGRTAAVLALSRAESARQFGPAELNMVESLAGRAASAVDNAALHQEVRNADRQKNEFLAMLGHELRNPLAPIRNAVQVLRLRSPEQPELRWARDVIDRQVQHMVRLVDDLLDISRITRGKIQLRQKPLDFAAIVAQAVEAARPAIDAREHHLELAVPDEPLWVNGDATRLAQVLTNLLNNAAKYTEAGGRLGLNMTREQDHVVVRVCDNGIGIPEEMLASIFDLFTQVDQSLSRTEGGLGIGLTLTRRLVEMHGGTVQAFSRGLNQGSEFVVRLPLLPAKDCPQPSSNGTAARNNATVTLRVLVVDDNVDGAESLATLLRLLSHEVCLAHNGRDAVAATREFRPDVILLDIGLPDIDGLEVAQRVRADVAGREALLVAITGYGQEEDRLRAMEAGFDYHLTKPANLDSLCEILDSIGPANRAPALQTHTA